MPAVSSCPAREELQRFLLGLAAEPQAEQIEQHLEACEHCLQTLRGLEAPDALLDAARGSQAVSAEDVTEAEDLVERLCRLRPLPGAVAAAVDERTPSPPSSPDAAPVTANTTLEAGGAPTPAPGVVEPLPAQLGRYRILGRLGSGGMGTVYKAHDPDLQRTVALKVPRFGGPAPAHAVARQRFLREARAAAPIRHPHVCPIHDVGEHDGSPYVVMAYVEGESLAERLAARGRFEDCREAVTLVRQLAEGLAAVHAHGIIHRDLKPGNVLLDRAGQPVLSDFGLARLEQDAEPLTAEGVLVGTPAYMAPEQLGPDPAAPGPATDVYSLGVVLYQMLTGRPPYEGPALQVVFRVAGEAPPPPSQLRPDLDPALDAVVRKAMARRPEERYPSALALRDALDAWSAGGDPGVVAGAVPSAAAPAHPSSPVRGSDLRARRRWHAYGRLRWAVPALLAPVLLVLVTGTLLVRPRGQRAEHTFDHLASAPPGTHPPEKVPQPGSNRTSPLDRLDLVKALAEEPLQAPPHGLVAVLRQPPEVVDVAFAADGGRLLSGGEDGTAILWDLVGRKELRRFERPRNGRGTVTSVAFSPDGRRVLTGGSPDAVRVWDLATGQELHTLLGHTADVLRVTFSPDGRRVASADKHGTVRVSDLASGKEDWHVAEHGVAEALRFSPDGRQLLTTASPGGARLWDAATGAPLRRLDANGRSAALSPDGRTLFLGGDDGTVSRTALNAPDGAAFRFGKRHQDRVSTLAVAPSGHLLASASDRDGQIILWSAGSGDELSHWQLPCPVNRLAFDPGGRYLATANANGTVYVLRLAAPPAPP
jgi:WD40 repeat protein